MEIMVDYPLFKGRHNSVFITVISRMFARYQIDMQSQTHEEKRKILAKFQEVFLNLRTLDSSPLKEEGIDTISILAELASASDIDNHFTELLKMTGYTITFKVSPIHVLSDREKKEIIKINQYQANK